MKVGRPRAEEKDGRRGRPWREMAKISTFKWQVQPGRELGRNQEAGKTSTGRARQGRPEGGIARGVVPQAVNGDAGR